MTRLDRQQMETIDRNFSAVVALLNLKLKQTSVQLSETPCYFYLGEESKLEVTVFSNPRIATIDVRLIKLKSDDKEPYFEHSYDLNGLSITTLERDIDDLTFKCNEPQ